MDKQEQINEMIEAFKDAIGNNALIDMDAEECALDCNGVDHAAEQCAKALYNAGYRKQSDTVREFLKLLKEKESPKLLMWEYGEGYLDCIKTAEELAAEYDAGVEE